MVERPLPHLPFDAYPVESHWRVGVHKRRDHLGDCGLVETQGG
jgi:hypothetical protein